MNEWNSSRLDVQIQLSNIELNFLTSPWKIQNLLKYKFQ